MQLESFFDENDWVRFLPTLIRHIDLPSHPALLGPLSTPGGAIPLSSPSPFRGDLAPPGLHKERLRISPAGDGRGTAGTGFGV